MLGSVVRVVRSGLSPPPFRPDLWINRVGAPRTGLRPFALPRPDWLSPRCGLNVVAAYTARTSPKGDSRKFTRNFSIRSLGCSRLSMEVPEFFLLQPVAHLMLNPSSNDSCVDPVVLQTMRWGKGRRPGGFVVNNT